MTTFNLSVDEAWRIAEPVWHYWDRHAEPSWRVADRTPPIKLKPIGRGPVGDAPVSEIIKSIRFDRMFVGTTIVITSPDFPTWQAVYSY